MKKLYGILFIVFVLSIFILLSSYSILSKSNKENEDDFKELKNQLISNYRTLESVNVFESGDGIYYINLYNKQLSEDNKFNIAFQMSEYLFKLIQDFDEDFSHSPIKLSVYFGNSRNENNSIYFSNYFLSEDESLLSQGFCYVYFTSDFCKLDEIKSKDNIKYIRYKTKQLENLDLSNLNEIPELNSVIINCINAEEVSPENITINQSVDIIIEPYF